MDLFKKIQKSKKGSPLVEESILLGITLFAFLVIATVIFDLVEFAKNIFSKVTNITDTFP